MLLHRFNAVSSPERFWHGPKPQEVWRTPYAALSQPKHTKIGKYPSPFPLPSPTQKKKKIVKRKKGKEKATKRKTKNGQEKATKKKKNGQEKATKNKNAY